MSKKRSTKSYYIFRAWITDKKGNRIYAKDHGLKAFRILVSDKKA